MEKRVISRVNPYVSARFPVHCSCCDAEVKPAMSIERGYAVEDISLVEPLNPKSSPEKTAKTPAIKTLDSIAKVEVETKDNTMPAVNSGVQDIVMVSDATGAVETETKMVVDEADAIDPVDENDTETISEDETDETLVQKSSSNEMQTSNEGSDQVGDEESDLSAIPLPDADKVQKVLIVSPRTYKGIGQALDKTRLCLQKTNRTTMKRIEELSQEGREHIEAFKKLVEENIPKQGSVLVEDLSFISKELFGNLEFLKEKMIDCQRKSLLDTINTLKQDIEAELATMDETEESEETMVDDIEDQESFNGPFTILKDAPWALYGFFSILAANVGFFSQPWLFQSLHTCAINFTGYLKNSTFL